MPITEDSVLFAEKAVIKYKPSWLLKCLKFKYKEKNCYEFDWGSFTKQTGFKFEIIKFGNREEDASNKWALSFCFIYGSFWIKLNRF